MWTGRFGLSSTQDSETAETARTHLQRPGGAVNDAAIREKDTAFACPEQTDEVVPICNVGADYRRSNRGDVCSNHTQFRWTPNPEKIALELVYPACRFKNVTSATSPVCPRALRPRADVAPGR
jgi:hypothetical protein